MSSNASNPVLEAAFANGTLDRLLAEGLDFAAVARRLGVSSHAYLRWRKRHGARDVGNIAQSNVPDREDKPRDENGFADEDPTMPGVNAFDNAPDGFHVRGVSTLYDRDGVIAAQWVKTSKDQEDATKALLEAVARIADEWPSRAEPVEMPAHSRDDLLVVLPMGDPHIGMLAWEKECGENFDLAIAERNLIAAVDHLVDLAPPAKHCLLLTVGDTFHSDGLSNATTKGTRVDVDGRTAKMLTVGIRAFRRAIDRALEKHEIVDVKIGRGNHDHLLALVLSIALQQYYEREPRVRVDPSPEEFHWYRFGANLIGVTHGDKAKAMELMGVMAVDRARDWGETKYRRIYAGHLHHEITKEVPGVTIDHLNTLAGQDDWHRRMGYRSTRHMRMDVFHREDGFINRHIVGVEALTRAA